jgi:malate permease and related proteins
MVETLVQAYSPLVFWVGLGIISLRFAPESLPRILGRGLYWVGVPWQIFSLARYTDLSGDVGQVPLITVSTLLFGILLAWGTAQGLLQLATQEPEAIVLPQVIPPEVETTLHDGAIATAPPPDLQQTPALTGWQWFRARVPRYSRAQQGSFVLAGMLGNTGFVGLGLLPTLISAENMRWAVFFSLTQNLIGTYTIGVLVASHFGNADPAKRWWGLVQNVLFVPSLWAFALGYSTRHWGLPPLLDGALEGWYVLVIPASFVLMGMRLGQLEGWVSIQRALAPTLLKLLALPAFVGLGTTLLGMTGEPRLALVMMSGMPCAFAGLILAEEYDLDCDLAASTIALSTVGLLVMIPVWLWWFGA